MCLSMLSRTAALNWVLAEADLLSDYTKEGSQQRDSQVEQMPLGLRRKRADVCERRKRRGRLRSRDGSDVSTKED